MILEIDNVELNFSSKCILNGIYLKAETGKVTGILGNNGSGKTSLLEIIFGNRKPKYKLIRIDKKPILKSLYRTHLVKYLPQHQLIPNRIKLNKAFKLYNVDWEVFKTKFESFSKYEKRFIYNLSGGEQRIIEIYLTLKSPSKIVILDEPFSHLSPLYIEIVKTLISEEKKNKAIIVTDHMYRDIIDISNSIYLIKNGSTKLISNLHELEDYNYLNMGSLS
ncbi:ATP-binding cassette domain-containing protein [Flavobacteriaceae bacterium AU392]|nr:ABC transporter ATP-binding protein [Flavobacteriaceae bacterium]RKM81242.1 ATP-binding cassette domain-containing protein [Flavobacteriaceae bacterium AU392]